LHYEHKMRHRSRVEGSNSVTIPREHASSTKRSSCLSLIYSVSLRTCDGSSGEFDTVLDAVVGADTREGGYLTSEACRDADSASARRTSDPSFLRPIPATCPTYAAENMTLPGLAVNWRVAFISGSGRGIWHICCMSLEGGRRKRWQRLFCVLVLIGVTTVSGFSQGTASEYVSPSEAVPRGKAPKMQVQLLNAPPNGSSASR
jgi:hypothetical protein